METVVVRPGHWLWWLLHWALIPIFPPTKAKKGQKIHEIVERLGQLQKKDSCRLIFARRVTEPSRGVSAKAFSLTILLFRETIGPHRGGSQTLLRTRGGYLPANQIQLDSGKMMGQWECYAWSF